VFADGKTVGWQARNGKYQLWDAETWRPVAGVELLPEEFRSDWIITLMPNTRLLASRHHDGSVRLWEMSSGRAKLVLLHCDYLAYSPDERFLAAVFAGLGGSQGETRLYALDTGAEIATFTQYGKPAFSPDGRMLAIVRQSIELYELPSNRHLGTLSGHKRLVDQGSFSSDSQTFVTLGDDCTVKFWSIASRREILDFPLPLEDPTPPGGRAIFSADGNTLLATKPDSHGFWTRIWHVPSLSEIDANGKPDAGGAQSAQSSP
jgi:WD40 repeat protein